MPLSINSGNTVFAGHAGLTFTTRTVGVSILLGKSFCQRLGKKIVVTNFVVLFGRCDSRGGTAIDADTAGTILQERAVLEGVFVRSASGRQIKVGYYAANSASCTFFCDQATVYTEGTKACYKGDMALGPIAAVIVIV